MACALKADPINQPEQNLQCSVCRETLKDPRTLPCFHSFCKDCLEGVVKTCRDKAPRDQPAIREFHCPNCRTKFTLDPDKHVEDMPRNHFICNMVQATAVLDRETRIPCSHNCSQGFSVARCVTCEKLLCRECLTAHNNYRANDGHSVLSMEELSKPENRKKIQGKMYCNEHSDETLKVYCETCDQLICRDCMDFKHLKQNHSCLLVKDVANNYKELVASNNNAMENALKEGNVFLEQLSLTRRGVDQDAENVQRKIMQNKDAVLKNVSKMLDKKAETLLIEVKQIHKGKRTKLDGQTEKTKCYVENIKQSVQLSKTLVEQGTEEEIISSQKMMLDNANNLLAKRPEILNEPIQMKSIDSSCGSEKQFNEEVFRSLGNSLGCLNRGNRNMGEATGRETRVDLVSEKDKCPRFDRKIFVHGLPEGTTESSVHIHFGKKRNGGGDIKSVTCLPGGKATVVFEDLQVAEEVVKTEQIFKGKVLEVKMMKIAEKPNVEELRSEEGAEKKQVRTVQVFGLPEGTTEINVHIHFQKKKNGGGDIEKLTLTEGRAIVVFEDPRVAEEVVKTKQIFKGNVLEVKIIKIAEKPNVEELRSEERAEKKQARTVQVSGLPEGTTEINVHTHFQKKKNGGGDIESVTCLPGGKAIVVFEGLQVAKTVVNTKQTFKGNVLEVKRLGMESKQNVEKLRNEESAGEKQARTVFVSGIPEGTTENSVHIHFQKKRNGGGEVETVTCLTEGKAMVVFQDIGVAKAVVNTKQIFKENILEVKHLDTQTKPNDEELKKQEKGGGNKARAVSVSGLPEGATENSVHIHFQKKRNGGGEVEKVKLLPEGKAVVIFEDPEVAQKVVNTPQKFQGTIVNVKLVESEPLTNEEPSRKAENSKPEGGTVLVSGLPDGATENGVHIHFQKKRNGGGEITEVKLFPEKNEALVTFEDIEVAKTVVKTPQELKGQSLTVIFLKKESLSEVNTPPLLATSPDAVGAPETGRTSEAERESEGKKSEERKSEERKPEEKKPVEDRATASTIQSIDQVFSTVIATVNPVLMNTVASEHFWTDVFNVIQRSCGVCCQPTAYGVLITGTLSKVTHAAELLAIQWTKHCQDPHYNNVFNQGGFTTNQSGQTFNHGGMTAHQTGPTFNQSGMTTNQIGQTFNHGGMTTNQSGSTFKQGGMTTHQSRPSFNDGGTTNSIGYNWSNQNANYSLHLRNQQSGWNGEGQWKTDSNRKMDSNFPREVHDFGNASYYHPHSGHRDVQYVEKTPTKLPGFKENIENPRLFEIQQNTPSTCVGEYPYSNLVGEAEPSEENRNVLSAAPTSSLHSNTNLKQSGDGKTTTVTTATTENPASKVDGTSLLDKKVFYTKPSSSPSETRNLQQSGDDQTTTGITTGAGNPTPTVVASTSPPDKPDLNAKPSSSSSETRRPQPPTDNQKSTILNPTVGQENLTASNNRNGSPSNDTANPPPEKPTTTSSNSRTNHQPPLNNKQGSLADSGRENLTTSNNQNGFLSKDRQDSDSIRNNPVESLSNNKSNSGSESPPCSQEGTVNLEQNHRSKQKM